MSKEAAVLDTNREVRESLRRKKAKRKKFWISLLLFLVSIGIWTTVVYYGYNYAKDYVDTAIRNVQQENAMNIQQLTEEIQSLNQELINLRLSIENTDSTLSNSTSLQERIDERLGELDRQLEELERSLKILKEAPNVKN